MIRDEDSLPVLAADDDVCLDCTGRIEAGQMIALRTTSAGYRPVHVECGPC